jgi:uncharacterized protein (TIGR03437 family)
MTLRKTLPITIAAAAIYCFAISDKLLATAPNITYAASGTFAATPTSGSDTLKLAGEPFNVSIVVSSATTPFKHGPGYAAYNKLKLTGKVSTGLEPKPVPIASGEATIIQQIHSSSDPTACAPNTTCDTFTMEAPIRVVGIAVTLKAVVTMPLGTITKAVLYPFTKAVTMTTANATLTYSDSTASTVLGIQSGTLSGRVAKSSADAEAEAEPASVTLHSGGARAMTLHADGTVTVRRVSAGPIDLGTSMDTVTLMLYASGVSEASEVRAQIGGEEVPVVSVGASGDFPGLDEILVRLPQSLAGRGPTTVTITADGHTAGPVPIHIQ